MLKRFLIAGMIGANISIMTSLIILIFMSYIFSPDGKLYMVSDALILNKNSEISAVVFQFVIVGIAGFIVSCVSTIIFEISKLGIILQFFFNAVINYGIFLVVAILCKWGIFENNKSLILFTVIWFVIYIIICVGFFISEKNSVLEINNKLKNHKN
ncbi:MAG: DUF3021 family protein [Fusobacteriaceae bacterium]